MKFERQISVNASPDKVLDYVADINRHPEWTSRPLEVKQTSSGAVGVGSTFATTGKQFGKHTDTVTIKELIPGSRVVFESAGDAGVVRHWFEVTPSGSATTLKKGLEFEKLAFLTKLASGVVKKVAPKDLETCLAKIKSNLEGSA
jgi:carbon monoxide dehydrogenase subunit G